MIKKFGLQDAKQMSTPMGTNDQLGIDASGNMVDQKQYRSMIGVCYMSLLLDRMSCLVCASVQDIKLHLEKVT
jgi:hypothetical protein